MNIIDPSFEILNITDNPLRLIEVAGRTCYKSEDNICDGSDVKFADKLFNQLQHESVMEHANITVKFIHNRGFSHEIVRHRIASYSQESTRYCNYSKDKFGNEITLIKPYWWKSEVQILNDVVMTRHEKYGAPWPSSEENVWYKTMMCIEESYFKLLKLGLQPQAARGILPNDLKTEIIMTTNLRSWKNIFKLRTSKAAHPDMRRIMIPLLKEFKEKIPVIFDNIKVDE